MMNKLKLGVFFGGRSGEHAVSLMSARSVLSVLSQDKYEVFQIGITIEGEWLYGQDTLSVFESGRTEGLSKVILVRDAGQTKLFSKHNDQLKLITSLDVIFPVLHGTFGEDGTIQGLFEILDCAYVGAGVLASATGMDKAVCKDIAQNNQVPVLEWHVFNRSEIFHDLDEVIRKSEDVATYPLFVKPANLGSSVGISKARNRQELEQALLLAARFDRRVLVERGITAREIEVSVLGNDEPRCSVPGEIIPDDIFYTYQDKYFNGEPELLIPAPLSAIEVEQIQEYAKTVYKALDSAGMSRVDFLIERNSGEIFFSEINTIPGFTKISMYPKLWKASGLEYEQLVDTLIQLAIERKQEKEQLVRKFEN